MSPERRSLPFEEGFTDPHPPLVGLKRGGARPVDRNPRSLLDECATADLHAPLIGLHGLGERSRPPRRDELVPAALDRLASVHPSDVLLATDFDGTLAPIVDRPEAAQPLPVNLALIERLIDLGVHVAVISGRAQRDLRMRLPLGGPRILGENGMGEADAVERRSLTRFNLKAGRLIARQPGVWLECKPGSTSVHYRQAPESGPALRSAVLSIANRFGLVTSMGRMVIEVRPQRADKARAVSFLIFGLRPKAIVYAGDDEADQDVFRMLSRSSTLHLAVGVSSSERPAGGFRDCDLVVAGPEGMSEFLFRLLERVSRSRPA